MASWVLPRSDSDSQRGDGTCLWDPDSEGPGGSLWAQKPTLAEVTCPDSSGLCGRVAQLEASRGTLVGARTLSPGRTLAPRLPRCPAGGLGRLDSPSWPETRAGCLHGPALSWGHRGGASGPRDPRGRDLPRRWAQACLRCGTSSSSVSEPGWKPDPKDQPVTLGQLPHGSMSQHPTWERRAPSPGSTARLRGTHGWTRWAPPHGSRGTRVLPATAGHGPCPH